MRKVLIIIIISMMPILSVHAELCPSSRSIAIAPTTPSIQLEKVVDSNNAVEQDSLLIVDHKTRLMWARCQVGYDWNSVNVSCVPGLQEGVVDWRTALERIAILNSQDYLGYNDWRMPNIKELTSIVERRCHSPAINNERFQGVPDFAVFWSNTHEIVPTKIDFVKVVNFGFGIVESRIKTELLYLRPVRDVN